MGVVVGVGTDLPMRNRGGFFRISGLTCVGIPLWVFAGRAYDRLACLMAAPGEVTGGGS